MMAIGSDAGHVRIYSWTGSSWSKLGPILMVKRANDYSGYSVSLSADGQTVAIGAHENDGNGDRSGHVRIYSWTGSSWSKLGADIDGEATYDYQAIRSLFPRMVKRLQLVLAGTTATVVTQVMFASIRGTALGGSSSGPI